MEENKYPLFPELTDEGKIQAKNLIDKFEHQLKLNAIKLMGEITDTFYSDVLHHIESDHWQNYRNTIMEGMCNYSNKEHSPHDFDRIRKAIYMYHKEEIIKDLNQDLVKEIERLKKLLSDFFKTIK